MVSNSLESFKIFTEFAIELIGKQLTVFTIYKITLSVQEPCWNLVLCWVLQDCDDSFELIGIEFTGSV